MSVYIRGMEMPTNCMTCDFFEQFTSRGFFSPLGYCMRTGEEINVIARGLDCPLVELPPHGRLIDADAFREEMDKHYPFDKLTQSKHRDADAAKSTILVMLTDAPTIIPAEEVQDA